MDIQIHPRKGIVDAARREVSASITQVLKRHDLTYSELWLILSGEANNWAQYAVRDERKRDTKGG